MYAFKDQLFFFKGLEMKWFQKFVNFSIHKSLVEMGIHHSLCQSFAVVICKKHFGSLFQSVCFYSDWVSVLHILVIKLLPKGFYILMLPNFMSTIHLSVTRRLSRERLNVVPFHKSVYNTSFSLKCLEQIRFKKKVNKMIMLWTSFFWA